jgi:membrane peptidoglycan carboxypeptidase
MDGRLVRSAKVVGVWVGNDDNTPMDRIVGGDLPAKIWHDFVEEAERIMSRPVSAAAVRQSVASLGASGRSPTKKLSIVKQRVRVHGRRLSWLLGWHRSVD